MKLFVSGFPLDMTEIDIVKLFNLHGTVNTIKIVRDKKTRICKGYAFLEMTDQTGADRAIEALDGTPMGDRMLTVKQTVEQPAAKPQSNFSRNNPPIKRYNNQPAKPGEPVKPKRPRKLF